MAPIPFLPAGWSLLSCQEGVSGQGPVLALKVSDPSGKKMAILALRFPDAYHDLYTSEEDYVGAWSSSTFSLADQNGDGADEVWLRIVLTGTGHYLYVEVVDLRPDGSDYVGGVNSLSHGTFTFVEGGAVVTSTADSVTPAPTVTNHITWSGVSWQIDDAFALAGS